MKVFCFFFSKKKRFLFGALASDGVGKISRYKKIRT
jgi:hypothetical protein